MAIQKAEAEKILNGDIKLLVEKSKSLGEELARNLKTSQLRNIYGFVRHAQMEWEKNPQVAYDNLILLMPKLAYFSDRTKGAMRPLKDDLDQAILVLLDDKGPNQLHFKNFLDYCEAVVAYHRANRKEQD